MALTKVKAGNIILTTPGVSSNDVTPATTQYVTTAIGNLIDTAPSTLNTLNELAAALGDNENFSTTVTDSIATKLPLAGGTMTGALVVDAGNGGLDIRLGTDKRVYWAGNIGEIGSTAGFQATNTAGSALAAFGIRASELKFATGSATRMTINASGNVGIGVTVPTTALHVNGAISLDYGTGVSYQGIKRTSVGNEYYVGTTSTATHEIHTFTGSSDVKKMVILESGNVGIGTATPDYNLEVEGASGTTIAIKTPWAQDAYGQYKFATPTGEASMRSRVPGNSTVGLEFYTYGTNNGTAKMSILGNGDTSFVGEVSAPLFNGIVAHVGTSAPSSPAVGKLWFNTTSGVAAMYVYDGSGWDRMSNKVSATGGTVVTSGDYTYHTFTSSGTFTALSSGTVELLMVAGGGCGGSSTGGGGGAGGLIYNTSIGVTPQSYTVTVGAGQPAAYKNTGRGSNSVALGLTAIGGGGGGWSEGDTTTGLPSSGGSGGGGQSYYNGADAGGAGTSGQGNAGGTGGGSYSGGGGGAGAVGTNASSGNPGNGGAGLAYSTIATATSTGASTYYAGGAGGAIGGSGGAGGGGAYTVAGTVNTGGGGGSDWGHGANVGASGGSGIVIIRYRV